MKLKDVRIIEDVTGLTLDELEIDIGQVITSNEFNKGENLSIGEMKDFRERAIVKLIEEGYSFESNQNILTKLFKKMFTTYCPVCECSLESSGSTGNSDTLTLSFKCPECGLKLGLSMPHNAIDIVQVKK